MSKKIVLLHRGAKFESEGGNRFAKDVLPVGKLFHPVTKKELDFPLERIQNLAKNTQRYHDAGNKVPYRDGHRNSVLANMGKWPGPFVAGPDFLAAVCEPTDPKAIEGMKNGSIDGVSVVIEFDLTDSLKNHYDEVITAIDATDFPVYPGQGGFTQLSKDHDGAEVYVHESVELAKADPGDGDCMAQHDALHADLKGKLAAYSKSKAKNGADHADTKAAGQKAQEAAQRLRKQAQVVHDHTQNMTGGPTYYDRSRAVPTVAEALEELSQSSRVDWKAVAEALTSDRV